MSFVNYVSNDLLILFFSSPDSVGSRLLHEYNFKEITPPNLVFLDHSTSRVCNYPDIEMIKSENDLFGSITAWTMELLTSEGSCSGKL